METVVLTIHLLLALALIIVVLLQRSEGGGLGMGGGGGGGIMSGRAAATALSKLTWALGAGFVVTSLTLTILAARQNGDGSVLDRLGVGTGVETPADAVPGVPDDFAPPPLSTPAPGASDGPSVPPPVSAPATPPAATTAPAAPVETAPSTPAPAQESVPAVPPAAN